MRNGEGTVGTIFLMGGLSALLLMVLFILFGGVLFVLGECCFHGSEKEGGLVTDGCRVFLGTFSRCSLCFDSPFLLIFRMYVFVDMLFFL